jgi:hypothetical protein
LEEIDKIISLWNEETPVNLQRKFLYTYITWNELVWRAGEVVNCLTDHFTKEVDNPGTKTAPVICNPVFNKTTQAGDKPLTVKTWLISNFENPDKFPVKCSFMNFYFLLYQAFK